MLNRFERNSRNLIVVAVILFVIAFALILYLLSKTPQESGGQSTFQNAVNGVIPPQPTPVPLALQAKTDVPAMQQFTVRDGATFDKYFQEVHLQSTLPVTDYIPGKTAFQDLLANSNGTRILATGLPKGAYLLSSELITGTTSSMIDYSGLLDKGSVAQAVSVPPLASENGLIAQGDHVNVLLSVRFNVTKGQVYGRNVAYFPTDTNVDSSTPDDHIVGYIIESQTTLENLKVLNVAGNTYTLEMTNQEAVLFKNMKDSSAADNTRFVIDLVVRDGRDAEAKKPFFTTDPINTNFLQSGQYTHGNRF